MKSIHDIVDGIVASTDSPMLSAALETLVAMAAERAPVAVHCVGGPVIRAHYTPIAGATPDASLVVWPSWSAWASTYGRCRQDYLAHFSIRFSGVLPASERLFLAFERDGPAAAEAEKARLREEERLNDPRLVRPS